MKKHRAGVVLRMFVQPDAGDADCQLWDEVCGLDGEKI
jgi:hypothetical protein